MITAKWVEAVPLAQALCCLICCPQKKNYCPLKDLFAQGKRFLLSPSSAISARCPWRSRKIPEHINAPSRVLPHWGGSFCSPWRECVKTMYKPGKVSNIWKEAPEAARQKLPSFQGWCLMTRIKSYGFLQEKSSHHSTTPQAITSQNLFLLCRHIINAGNKLLGLAKCCCLLPLCSLCLLCVQLSSRTTCCILKDAVN